MGIIPIDPIVNAIPSEVRPLPFSPPRPPGAPSVARGSGQVTVTWTALTDDAGSPITNDQVTSESSSSGCATRAPGSSGEGRHDQLHPGAGSRRSYRPERVPIQDRAVVAQLGECRTDPALDRQGLQSGPTCVGADPVTKCGWTGALPLRTSLVSGNVRVESHCGPGQNYSENCCTERV